MAQTTKNRIPRIRDKAEAKPFVNGANGNGGALANLPASEGIGDLVVSPIKRLTSLPVWALVIIAGLIVGSVVSFGAVGEVPERIQIGTTVSRAVDKAVDYMVVNWNPFFSAINIGLLRYFLLPLENWLLALPWWLVSGVVVVAALRLVGPIFGIIAGGMMVLLAFFGLFDLTMTTLAIVITSTVLAVILGVPTGIVMAKNRQAEGIIRPVLDLMQTMPSFVYLIPVLMLFGLGKVPAVIAVVIYAVPPVIRLTNLGIRQVDSGVVEAARAFGATAAQLLVKVQLPLALPTIMAGLNQTIMMALAMVVVASMIGARGLGIEVLNGIARLEVGRGLLGGIGIVIMAIILDRLAQGLGMSTQRAKRAAA